MDTPNECLDCMEARILGSGVVYDYVGAFVMVCQRRPAVALSLPVQVFADASLDQSLVVEIVVSRRWCHEEGARPASLRGPLPGSSARSLQAFLEPFMQSLGLCCVACGTLWRM